MVMFIGGSLRSPKTCFCDFAVTCHVGALECLLLVCDKIYYINFSHDINGAVVIFDLVMAYTPERNSQVTASGHIYLHMMM